MPTRLAGRIIRLLLILAVLGSQWAWAAHDHPDGDEPDLCQWCAYQGHGKALVNTAPPAAVPDSAGLPQPAPNATQVAHGPGDWRLRARGPPQKPGRD